MAKRKTEVTPLKADKWRITHHNPLYNGKVVTAIDYWENGIIADNGMKWEYFHIEKVKE